VLKGDSVLIKGDRIACVGKDTGAIGRRTTVIDAAGKTLLPGLIDGHTHIDLLYTAGEFLRYAVKGGTTTIITETSNVASVAGYEGVIQFLRSTKNQPVKVFITAPPMVTISPMTEAHSLTVGELRRLLRRAEVVGLGEPYWGQVVGGSPRVLGLITETLKAGKRVDGHSSGASPGKLEAYVASGVSSCHEPITAGEVMERLRLGLFVLVREGEIRRELEAISQLKDEGIDFSRLAISTDGIGAWQLVSDGYMEFVVQKAIDLGFDPVRAIQMATIAPGRYADIVIVPDLQTIRAEYVISNGQVVARNGRVIVPPRKHRYPASARRSVYLSRDLDAGDFAVRVESPRREVRVRVIDQVTELVTREAIIGMPLSDGELESDTTRDILKVAAIERSYHSGRAFTGFIRGIGLKAGAIATSGVWDSGLIIAVGADDAAMAQAVNRVGELDGGIVVCDRGRILAEIPLPVWGLISTEPMEMIARRLYSVQGAAAELGCTLPDIRITLAVLATPAIAHLRICEDGLFNLRENRFVDLIVD
jgi:adenine deaminase